MDDQATAALDEERRGEARSDVLRPHAAREHVVPERERPCPEGRPEVLVLAAVEILVAGPGVVDEDVEPAAFRADPVENGTHLVIVAMVAANRDRLSPERLGLLGRVLDRPAEGDGRRFSANRPPREVDRCAGFREPEHDALPDAAAGARYEGHASGERHAPHQKLAAITT